VLAALAVAGLSFRAPPVHAQEPPTPDFAAVDRFVEEAMRATRLPGLALALVRGDRVVHLRGFGRADPSGRAATPQTPFLIASATKPITALAIMQLVEAGAVDLDAPAQRYLPWFRVADVAASGRITVRQLLNHTSGLPTLTGHEHMVFAADLGEAALEERVRALRTTRLTAPPGERYQYSNAGYAALALIVQAVSGQPYDRYLQRHVYAPLQMRRSFVSKAEAQRHGLATGYRYWFGFPAPHDWSYSHAELGAGFTYSSAEDLAHYLIAQLNGGRYGGTQVLSPDGIAAMQRPAAAVPHGGPDTATLSYGLGWFVREANGVRTVAHSGVAPNFRAELVLAPEAGWGVVVLANGENSMEPRGIGGIASGATGLLLGAEVPPLSGQSDLMPTILRVVLVAVALQALGLIRTGILLRRWRAHPEGRPRGRLGVGLQVVPSLLLNLAWGLACMVALPGLFMLPLAYLRFEVPDLGYTLTLSGALALAWGLLRPVLVLLALRGGRASAAAGVPVTA
jgi:CubicO group peptidase (beta-lactamase class C family)